MSDLCTVCGLTLAVGEYPCITTIRPHVRGINGAIGDECDIWQENGFHTPQHFTSKKARIRALAANGLEERVCHAGEHDRIVPRWAAIDPQTLANAEALATRNGSGSGQAVDTSSDVPVTWTIRDLS